MTRTSLKTKIAAIILSVITVLSIAATATVSASAASAADVLPDAGYAAGIGIIRQYIPGGQAIAGVIDTIINSCRDNGPSLSDISDDIENLRSEISTQFSDIKNKMEDYTEEIENKIVDQTVIAGKGVGFDKLMTALRATDRQIRAINSDATLNDNEKAVEIASLIGKNTEWNKANNMYFAYQDFMNTLGSSSFADQKDRDLYQVVYNDFTSKVMFSGEALDMSKPYIDRVMLLGLYAYSINSQCLKAAQTVSKFTDKEVATLNADEQNNYHNIKSLTSIVNAEIVSMHDHMFSTDITDSVISHLGNYENTSRLVFLNKATANKPFTASMRMGDLSQAGDESRFYDICSVYSAGALSIDEIKTLASYVRSAYPGKSLREYLTYVGFDMSNVPQNAIFVVGSEETFNAEGRWDGGGIGMCFSYRFPAISVNDASVSASNHNAFRWGKKSNGVYYHESISNEFVINFTRA